MAQSRIPGQSPKSEGNSLEPGEGAAVDAPSMAYKDIDKLELDKSKDGNWAQLREKDGKDQTNARGKEVSGEYKALVDAYFEAISKKARDKK